ncbi:hypothetical protein GYH30_030341 [Glycine max]|nr:hypothetical protein GYH30_030341 [Glycine max]
MHMHRDVIFDIKGLLRQPWEVADKLAGLGARMQSVSEFAVSPAAALDLADLTSLD